LRNENTVPTFKDFLLSEYQNIAQAHFKSTENISTFFRYYVLIMSIPISVIGYLFMSSEGELNFLMTLGIYKLPLAIASLSLYVIGLGVFCFIVNLRMDVILYARVVNGIRKHFYDDWDEDVNTKLRLRVLPQSPQLPSYFEGSFAVVAMLVFSVINSGYGLLGSYILASSLLGAISSFSAMVILHLLIYFRYCEHRERAYIRSNILGIDIDGVLCEHRKQFCSLLRSNTGKILDPNQITVIPVHEHPDLDVTREDERKVMNDPKYWVDMDVFRGAAETIKKLKKTLKLSIYIFTWRGWPSVKDRNDLAKYRKEFSKHCGRPLVLKSMLYRIIPRMADPLKTITKKWLKKHGFLYDRFIFEKGNDFSSDPRGKFRNRFSIARKKKIRFFVEDDIEKATKLSYVCDVVFLFSHPYNEFHTNQPPRVGQLIQGLPSNVIRVRSWSEIYQEIRRLS